MCATAAHLIEEVLPEVALRQWVLTFPFAWRKRLAMDGRLLSALTPIFLTSVHALYAGARNVRGLCARPARSFDVRLAGRLKRLTPADPA